MSYFVLISHSKNFNNLFILNKIFISRCHKIKLLFDGSTKLSNKIINSLELKISISSF